MSQAPEILIAQVLKLTHESSEFVHQANRPGSEASTTSRAFVPHQAIVRYEGRFFTENEVAAVVSSTLDLWLKLGTEGNALGYRYADKLTGAFGDLSKQSLCPPHHLTMGEGGAANVVRGSIVKALIDCFRDWGRDHWYPIGNRAGADRIMCESVFPGTYPGLAPEMPASMARSIRCFVTA